MKIKLKLKRKKTENQCKHFRLAFMHTENKIQAQFLNVPAVPAHNIVCINDNQKFQITLV